MQNVLISGKTSFKIEVPYKLIETGKKGEKPLILYLHGFNQNLASFEKLVEPIKEIEAFHLFIQGPYPVYPIKKVKEVEDWGRAWYLYDGKQEQFIKSMEVSSEFIQEIVDGLVDVIKISRLCVLGYSMGGYLAGYFAFSRWRHVNDLIVIGGRIKTETFEEKRAQAKHINILALHGKDDTDVYPEPQQKCVELLKDEGFNAEFKLLPESHALTPSYINKAVEWLKTNSY